MKQQNSKQKIGIVHFASFQEIFITKPLKIRYSVLQTRHRVLRVSVICRL